MDTQSAIFLFVKENVCNGYHSLEAAPSSVNAVHSIGSHAKIFKLQSRKL